MFCAAVTIELINFSMVGQTFDKLDVFFFG